MLLAAASLAALWAMSCARQDNPATAAAAVTPGSTVVTMMFSDTFKSHTRAAALLNKYGLKGVFYVNSGRIDGSDDLSLSDLRGFVAAGHEIGGHTINHTNLDEVPISTVIHEVCDDRVALLELGFPVATFGYPSSSDSDTARQIVISCNYNNARVTGRIRNPFRCSSCPLSESIPPLDVFRIRTPASITKSYDLADLQSLVTQVESSDGGWMLVSLHHICAAGESCSGTYDVREALLEQFLAWLAPRSSLGTYVMTPQQVIGGPVKPGVRSDGGIVPFPDAGTPDAGAPDGGTPDAGAPDAGAPDGGSTLPVVLQNPSLEADSDGDNVPDCWKRQNLGSTGGGWLRTTDTHTGAWAQRVRISTYGSGDRRLVVLQDSGSCAPAAVAGRSYRISAWYKTDSRAGFVVSYRTGGVWLNWMSGPDLPTSPLTYVRGEWTTPPLPAGATNISVGLALRGVGYLFMDDFELRAE